MMTEEIHTKCTL